MLYKFDASKVSFEHIRVKTINSVGGSISIVDESVVGKEKTKRYECPNTITRAFKAIHGITQFQIPHECCVMKYDGTIIAIEKAAINERTYIGLDGTEKNWIPEMESVYKKVLSMADGEWYIDGTYLYQFKGGIDNAIANGPHLTADGRFRSVECNAIMLSYIGFHDDIFSEGRNCLAYVADNGEYSITPPIWKTYNFVGGLGANEEGITLSDFNKAEASLLVNLQFAITAGINITRIFGYKRIEPLQLPRLMVQLRTVNLQLLPQEVKETFDIGMSFLQALAWLMGLMKQVPTFDDMMYMKRLIKYLTSTGTNKRKSMEVLTAPNSVPLMTMEQALENAKRKAA
jgi:hypothetical protein